MTGDDRDRVYSEQARRYPGFAEYEQKTSRVDTGGRTHSEGLTEHSGAPDRRLGSGYRPTDALLTANRP